eukprot:gene13208-5392_t
MSQQSGGGGAAATSAATVDQRSPSTSRWHSTVITIMASGVTKSNMEAWMNLTHPDVRTKKKVKDALRQTSLLEYTCQSGT